MTAKIKQSTKPDLSLNPAQRLLFEEHAILVKKVAARYGPTKFLRDELAQEARQALVKAIKTFDPDRGVPLGAYAWKCMENRCRDFLRRPPQPKSHDDLAVDAETQESMTLFELVERRAARRELQSSGDEDDYNATIEKVRYTMANCLDGIERRVALLRLRDFRFEEIAARLRIPKTTAHRLFQRCLPKVRKALEK